MPERNGIWLRRLALLMALSWMALLFYLSHQHSLPTPSLFPGQDKLFHGIVYGVLGLMLLASHAPRGGFFGRSQIGTSVLVASLYGASDELHQSFVPGRSAELGDWLADTLGALVAVLAVAWLVGNRRALKPATEREVL